MKTLSMIFGMLLVVGLMISPASAVNWAIDVDGNGTGDAALAIEVGDSTTLDFYIEAYSCAPDDKLFGVQAYIGYNPAAATISACSPNTAAQCDGSLSGCTSPGAGVLSLICSNFNFITVTGNKYKVGSATLTCDNEIDFNLTMANDIGAPYSDGFASDCNLGNVFPTDAVVAVDQFTPPCECAVTPATATVQSLIGSTVTQAFSAAANAFCVNPPAYDWTTTCTLGTVDGTGLLSVPETTVGESCQVCALDTANTGTEPCCSNVTILGAVTCSGEIYLGGAEGICSCVQQPPVDDPPYNRPGRRGLSLTCGDYVDFCACFDCEGTVDTTWTVVCTKPGLATIVETEECASRVTITTELCDVLAETAECTVTVTDPVNNWTDFVVIQVGEIDVDLSEETVSPETDSVGVDISVTNNSNTIRAMDIRIDECAQGEDNLVCTSCVADPDRALGFTCTAAEQPDGSCRVVLFSPVGLIREGEGVVATVIYDVIDPENCPECVDLCITAIEGADQFNEDLCACTDTGQVCFDVCGDIFPRECLNPEDPTCDSCGDGVVDLFDILEMVDIILAVDGYTGTACQLDNGDVPNGMPPYCGFPSGTTNCLTDGEVNIFDLMVIIDMALGKANCCDYCTSGSIF